LSREIASHVAFLLATRVAPPATLAVLVAVVADHNRASARVLGCGRAVRDCIEASDILQGAGGGEYALASVVVNVVTTVSGLVGVVVETPHASVSSHERVTGASQGVLSVTTLLCLNA